MKKRNDPQNKNEKLRIRIRSSISIRTAFRGYETGIVLWNVIMGYHLPNQI